MSAMEPAISVAEAVELIKRRYPERAHSVTLLQGRQATFDEAPLPVSSRLAERLEAIGVQKLYSHQRKAWDLASDGKHFVVVTSAASGKTLCFNLPVIERLNSEPDAKALYLFPTKALAQDQLAKLRNLTDQRASTYDGDTPSYNRGEIRQNARIILTNPDMLHASILPYHSDWGAFFKSLRYVVIDEIHTYRGVFGSHVANVMRRLRRIADAYGANPQFICCSATVGNPRELASMIIGQGVELIDEDGSPSSDRWLMVWRPPAIGDNERVSPNTEVARLVELLSSMGLRSIAFARSRMAAELVLRYVRESLGQSAKGAELIDRIESYRAGYLPEERRQIERDLFEGRLLSVIATNALELGIDVGGLDAVILNGYPGSVASFWQQIGRAGRGKTPALAIFVMHNDPLHAFLADRPRALVGRPVEKARLNAANPYILSSHLACAAHEKPLTQEDLSLFQVQPDQAPLKTMIDSGEMALQKEGWNLRSRRSPAREINIRSANKQNFLLVDMDSGRELAQVEGDRAFRTIHAGAVYLHRGSGYLVHEFDPSLGQAWARQERTEYYTQALTEATIEPLEMVAQCEMGLGELKYGKVRASEQVVGFARRRWITGELLATVELSLPVESYETMALWWHPERNRMSKALTNGLAKSRIRWDSIIDSDPESPHPMYPGMHAIEHALRALTPVFTGCDINDVSGTTQVYVPGASPIAVFLYDRAPGGIGLSEEAYERRGELFSAGLRHIESCKCDDGCPSCIYLSQCGQQNGQLDKNLAAAILRELICPQEAGI